MRIKRPTRTGIAARFNCFLSRVGEVQQPGSGAFVITHCTKSLEALLQSNDAFGYIGINDSVAEYILQSAWEELLRVEPMRRRHIEISICTLERGPVDARQVQLVQIAMQNTFRQLAMLTEIDIVRSTQIAWSSAWKSLWGGAVCFGAVTPLAVYYHDTFQYWAMILGQLFVIVFWILVWHPLEALVFDRIPTRKRLHVCQRLDNAKVTVVVFDDIKEEQEDEYLGTPSSSSTLLVDNGSRAKAERFGFEIVHSITNNGKVAMGAV